MTRAYPMVERCPIDTGYPTRDIGLVSACPWLRLHWRLEPCARMRGHAHIAR